MLYLNSFANKRKDLQVAESKFYLNIGSECIQRLCVVEERLESVDILPFAFNPNVLTSLWKSFCKFCANTREFSTACNCHQGTVTTKQGQEHAPHKLFVLHLLLLEHWRIHMIIQCHMLNIHFPKICR